MPEVLGTWDDHTGGHWGNAGPLNASPSQWGGANMILGKDGALYPACNSRWLELNASVNGQVWGMFWAWGADGRVYYAQTAGTSTVSSRMYRFTPYISNTNTAYVQTISTVSTFTFIPTTDPDWVESGTDLYVTMWGIFTYKINTTANTMTILTGSYGLAAAGRCIAFYGDRLFVGGVNSLMSGNVPNRIHFSGDDTGGTTYDLTAWETTNFFDIGNTGDKITGLYNLRDYLVAVLDDQSMYLINGTPPAPPDGSLSARRVYGFNKGSGGLSAFLPSHAAVDPSQTRLWMFDHTTRSPVRFNGANFSRSAPFGAPHGDREGDDVTEGATVAIGGPDEFVSHGVVMNRNGGEQAVGSTLELVRVNGVWCPVLNQVIAARQEP